MPRYNINIKDTRVANLTIKLCKPFPVGQVRATATPVFIAREDFRDYDPIFSSQEEIDAATRDVIVTRWPGNPLTYMTFSSATKSWTSVDAPTVTLASTFDQATGTIVVSFPFGATFKTYPVPEWRPGGSPRKYYYFVSIGDAGLVEGTCDVYVKPPPPVVASVCNLSLTQSEGAATSGTSPSPSSPWLGG